MNRRAYLIASVTGIAGSLAACIGTPVEEGNGSLDVDGTDVPLVSTETASEWYDDGELLVLDARGEGDWEEVRIAGAEWSPATDGRESNDPTEGVPSDTRILTYCVCPHTLAGRRGAALIEGGFTDVHALDEGLEEWVEEGLPIEGTDVADPPEETTLSPGGYHDG